MTTVDLGRLPRGQDGQLVIGNTGKSPLWKTVSGDATLSAAGALTLSAAYQTALTDIATLQAQVAVLQTPHCFSVHKNGTNQTGVSNGAETQLTWGTEVYDVGSNFASNVWTPPAGKVFLTATAVLNGTLTDTFGFRISITKGGATTVFKSATSIQNSGAGIMTISIEDIATGSNAYGVSVNCAIASGTGTIIGTSTVTYFMGHWISA